MSIDNELDMIKNNPYMETMRDAIHDGIKKGYDKSVTAENLSNQAIGVTENLLDGTFDSAALQADFENKLNTKIDSLQPEWTQFKNETDGKFDNIDNELENNKKHLSQMDFVEFIKLNSADYKDISFSKISETAYRIMIKGDANGVIYQFKKDYQDDFIKLDTCYVGNFTDEIIDKDYATVGDLTGSWVTTSGQFYTTEIGAKFSLSAKGSKITMHITEETRGGLWKIIIDNDTLNPVYISCYAPSTGLAFRTIAEDLNPDIEHTIVGEFLGDDPENNPSSNPSRGYLFVNTDLQTGSITGYENRVGLDNVVLAAGSNKEFAFNVSKDGQSNWIPEHNGIGSAYNIENPKFYIDGKEYNVNDAGIGEYVKIENRLELKQKFNGRIGAVNILEIETSHSISKDGLLTFNGSAEALTDFTSTGYPLMLPADSNYSDTFLSGVLNAKTSLGDESYTYFEEEKDEVFSAAVLSSVNKNIIGAATLLYPIKSYRIGKTGKPITGNDLFVWNRLSTPKIYFTSMENNQMLSGDFYIWGFKLSLADIDNVYEKLKK